MQVLLTTVHHGFTLFSQLLFLPWAIQHSEFTNHRHHLLLPVTLVCFSACASFCQSITFHQKNTLEWSCVFGLVAWSFDANLGCFTHNSTEVIGGPDVSMESSTAEMLHAPSTVQLTSGQIELSFSGTTGLLTQLRNANTGVCYWLIINLAVQQQ
jgi:hypothetical protein